MGARIIGSLSLSNLWVGIYVSEACFSNPSKQGYMIQYICRETNKQTHKQPYRQTGEYRRLRIFLLGIYSPYVTRFSVYFTEIITSKIPTMYNVYARIKHT